MNGMNSDSEAKKEKKEEEGSKNGIQSGAKQWQG